MNCIFFIYYANSDNINNKSINKKAKIHNPKEIKLMIFHRINESCFLDLNCKINAGIHVTNDNAAANSISSDSINIKPIDVSITAT